MLTVKIIRSDKKEKIVEVDEVEFIPAEKSETKKSKLECCSFTIQKGFFTIELFLGTAYVMNNNGKTVGTYILGVSPNEP